VWTCQSPSTQTQCCTRLMQSLMMHGRRCAAQATICVPWLSVRCQSRLARAWSLRRAPRCVRWAALTAHRPALLPIMLRLVIAPTSCLSSPTRAFRSSIPLR
ncbi:hypothetical protein IWW56_006535, partial [Coemansia sp. RSA 2131]